MAAPFDVCIRGAGVVGRVLALLLARERLRVLLAAPQRPAGASDVRAYALNAASRELLESVRGWPGAAHACAVRGMEISGDEGGHVSFSAERQQVEALAWIADVPALEHQLDEALRYQPLVQRADAVQPAALTVICEGRASATRESLGVDYEVFPYPQRAIAARLHCEKPHAQVARQWFTRGEILAFLPLGEPGGNSVALVWSVPGPRAEGLLALAPEAFAAALEAASGLAQGRLALASERAAWPLQLARARQWCGPGWVLAGDAAHTVHPLAGQGLNLGLADARELARVMRERDYWRGVADVKVLRRYERARQADVWAMGVATDGLQQLFSRQGPPWQALRNWGMRGFDVSGPLKQWVARQAMALP